MTKQKNKSSPKTKSTPYVSTVDDTLKTIETIEEPITDQSTDPNQTNLFINNQTKTNLMNFPTFSNAMAVKSGARVTTNEAQVIAASTYNHFILTNKAMKQLGVEKGDCVQLFDATNDVACIEYDGDGNQLPMELGKRFFIAKAATGALVDGKGGFSYSGVWGAIHVNDGLNATLSGKDVVAKGLAIVTKGKISNNYIATQKVTFELKPVLDEDGEKVLAGAYPVFSMLNPVVEASTPKVDAETIIG